MRDVRLTEEARKALEKEFGKDSIKIDHELNELAKLSIKRKNCIQAVNRNNGNLQAKESYLKISEEIKKLVSKINNILASI